MEVSSGSNIERIILWVLTQQVHCLSILLKYFGPSLARLGQTMGTWLSLFSQPSERQHWQQSGWNYFSDPTSITDWKQAFNWVCLLLFDKM